MNKKGQISAFIIIGLVILVSGFSLYYLDSLSHENLDVDLKATTESDELLSVGNYVRNCVEDSFKDSIIDLGISGGYYFFPYETIPTEYSQVPLYFFEDKINMPTLSDYTSEFSKYSVDMIIKCLGDFDSFKRMGKGYMIEGVIIDTEITDANILSTAAITIKENGTLLPELKFNFNQPLRIKEILFAALQMVNMIDEDPYHIHISQFFDIMETHNLQVDAIRYSNDTMIYIIEDNSTLIDEIPYIFIFGTKIDLRNKAPFIMMEDVRAIAGVEYENYILATDPNDDDLVYWSDSTLFFVDPFTGYFSFIPSEEQIGIYEITFSVTDGLLNASETIIMEII